MMLKVLIKKYKRTKYKLCFTKNDDLIEIIKKLPERKFDNLEQPIGWVLPLASLFTLRTSLRDEKGVEWVFETPELETKFIADAKKQWIVVKAAQLAAKERVILNSSLLELKETLKAQTEFKVDFESYLSEGITLYHHQKYTPIWLDKAKSAILAAEMGLGKSLMFLLTAQMDKKVKKVLIICPNSLKVTLANEIEKFFDGVTYHVINRGKHNKYEAKDAKYIIVNYEYFNRADFDPKKKLYDLGLQKVDMLICDESHRLKESTSNTFKNINKYIVKTQKTPPRIILSTGTPIKSYSREIFTQLHLLNPAEFPNQWDFEKTYCGAYRHPVFNQVMYDTRKEDIVGLRAKLEPYMLRIKKEDALDLPEKIFINLTIELSPEERKVYNEIERGVANEIFSAEKMGTANALTILLRLREYCSIVKIKYIRDVIESQIQEGNKVVFIDFFKNTLKELYGYYEDVSVLHTGAQNTEQRSEAIEEFIKPFGGKDLFIGSSSTCNAGLTLVASHILYLNTLSWSVADCDQIMDRCIAKGQQVFTKNGYVNIEDISLGDKVLSHLGNWCEVTNKMTKLERKKPFVEIKYKGYHNPLVCTFDHKCFVYDKTTGTKAWVEAGKLNLYNHYMLLPVAKNQENNHILFLDSAYRDKTAMGPILPSSIEVTPMIAEALGHFLAEGCCNDAIASATGHKKEEDEVTAYGQVLQNAFSLKHMGIYKRGNDFTYSLHSRQLAKQMRKWFYSKTKLKKVPDFVLAWDKTLIDSFLKGYLFGDGYKRKNRQQASVMSHIAVSGLVQLFLQMGQTPSVRFNPVAGVFNIEYSLLSTKEKLIHNDGEHQLMPLEEIKIFRPSRGSERVYDLTVDNDSSFVIGHASVHNCHRIGQQHACYYYFPLIEGTVDESIYAALERKRQTFSKLIDGVDYINTSEESVLGDILKELKEKYAY